MNEQPRRFRTPSIIDALVDEDLFAAHFKGESWAAWKAMLGALFAP